MKLIVKNPTAHDVVIPGVPMFSPGEEREMDEKEALKITNGNCLQIVEKEVLELDVVKKENKKFKKVND